MLVFMGWGITCGIPSLVSSEYGQQMKNINKETRFKRKSNRSNSNGQNISSTANTDER